MFWPDDEALSAQTWWTWPAWADGPTNGALIAALRPALRAALLLGYQVHSIDVGVGASTGQTTDWQSIELATLTIDLAKPLPYDKPYAGANVRFGVSEVADLLGSIDGTYAVGIDIPIVGSDEEVPESGEEPDQEEPADVPVPRDLVDGVGEFVDQAVDLLTGRIPEAASATVPMPADVSGGLLWMFDPLWWDGTFVPEAGAEDTHPVMTKLCQNMQPLKTDMCAFPQEFLRAQISGGPPGYQRYKDTFRAANLAFLTYGLSPAYRDMHVWLALETALQERGESHRIDQRTVYRLKADRLSAPVWLDVLCELLRLGVVGIRPLVEPVDPPTPVVAVAGLGTPLTELTLRVWGGDAEIVCRRTTVFADEGLTGLETSLAWDYLPGDAQNRPAVVVVAGRGVAIETRGLRHTRPRDLEHPWKDAERWDLAVYRVQNSSVIPQGGAAISSILQLSPGLIPVPDVFVATISFPALIEKPKPAGTILQFPAWGATQPMAGGSVARPSVIEITVDPLSGTAAYTLDAHYYTRPTTLGTSPVGGVHVCVWVTEGVRITTNKSPFRENSPQRGNPSALKEFSWDTAWTFSAELWEASPPNKMRRHWSTMLPATEAAEFVDDWAVAPPVLVYDDTAQTASYDGLSLKPALNSLRPDTYVNSVAAGVVDILVGFIPFWGDVTDIAECLLILATGRDKWGRPVSEFEEVLSVVGACVPLVSSGFLRRLGGLLGQVPADLPAADMGRLFVRSVGDAALPVDEAESAFSLAGIFQDQSRFSSPAARAEARRLILELANNDAAVGDAATRLLDGRSAGWPTVADVVTDDGEGFLLGPLQTAYSRYLRDHATLPPHDFAGLLRTGG